MGKVVQINGLIRIRNKAKRERKKVVFTNGCFDLLHRGHAEYLKKAKSLGDILVVGVNSDPSVRKIKGKGRPIISHQDRSFLLSSLTSVDYVIIFHESTPEKLITALQPDILVKGGDYKKTEIVGRHTVLQSGGKVMTIPLVKGYSTKKLLQKIRSTRRGNS
jgi:rfaE bifunctional protein nucleotidyltransferase chain/domain